MSSSKVDCHFFLTGSCRNGDQCPFRHSEGARSTEEVCSDYAQTGQCAAADCGKRHTETSNRMTKPPSEVACRNEENGGTCTRAGCKFMHSRPTQPSGGLNTSAKVFVPRPARPARPERPAAMEWTPASKAARPTVRPHANMEWTPATAAAATSSKPPPMPGAAGAWPQAGQQRIVGRPRVAAPMVARPQRPFVVSAFATSRPPQQQQPPPSHVVASLDSAQGMDVDMEGSDEPLAAAVQPAVRSQAQPPAQQAQPPAQQALRQPARLAAQPKIRNQVGPASQASPSGASSIPTIYDILGISEQAPASADRSARDRRAAQRPRASTTSLIPSAIFAPMPSASGPTHTPVFAPWPQPRLENAASEAVPVCDSILPVDVIDLDVATPQIKPPAASVVPTALPFQYSTRDLAPTPTPAPETPAPEIPAQTVSKRANEDIYISSNDSPLRAMASLDDLEFSEEDDHTGELEAPTIALQTASSILASPNQPPSSAPALAMPEAKAGVAQSKILAKSHVVPPPRDTKTSSPRLGTVADIAVVASPVPKILSFQEIMERKRRRQAEAIASDDAPRPIPPPVAEARSPAVEAKSPEAGVRVLAGKRRIVVDEDDVDSDASEGKRAKPEPPVQQPHVSEAIPDYVAMFERELEDLTADLDGPLENTPAGDMISRATFANDAFIDQDFESLLEL